MLSACGSIKYSNPLIILGDLDPLTGACGNVGDNIPLYMRGTGPGAWSQQPAQQTSNSGITDITTLQGITRVSKHLTTFSWHNIIWNMGLPIPILYFP